MIEAPGRTYLAGLNPAQHDAVTHAEGPLLVIAGAGSGKTRVLTTRIAWLIDSGVVEPKQVLSVTFTNKAAGEMKERIAKLLGHQPDGMWCGTFHAIGARMLRAHAPLAGRTSSFTIYDEDDTLAAIKRVMERLRISTKDFSPQSVGKSISDAKNALVSVAEYERLALDKHSRVAAQVYRDLNDDLKRANAVTFDDLLVLPVEILEANANVLASYRRRFKFILVDEYQDTNRAQYRFVALLGGEHQNVAAVGDDDQSIYGWRGADIRNILDFERDFPQARIVRLEENYRSTPNILAVANAAIQANTARRGKTLRTTRPAGDRARSVASLDERDEADWVLADIQGRRYARHSRSLRDFAILYRTNSQSRAIEESMRRHQVPYRLIGAVRFYDRREIRDLLAYLRLIANPADDEAYRRAVAAPRRGIGDTTIEALGDAAAASGLPMLQASIRESLLIGVRAATRSALAEFAAMIGQFAELARGAGVDEILRAVVEEIGYEKYLRAEGAEGLERLQNVAELISGAGEQVADEGGETGLTPLDHFLQRTTLVTSGDQLDPDADAVTLMTLHNAKGLEFPIVYITGLEEGLFPLAKARDDPRLMEEERRLFYVGVTRAEDTLTLTHARSRRRNGELLASLPSRFLKEVPADLVDEQATIKLRGSGKLLDRVTPSERRPGSPVIRREHYEFDGGGDEGEASQDLPRFVKGERVKHPRFGSGTIMELSGTGRDTKVTVDFDDETIGRKRFVVRFAGLQRGVE
jgi:DNA helicase-2/ATP-dependent DNA helicase PcrA